MTDQEMTEAARSICVVFDMIAAARGLGGGDRVALASMALSEWMAQHLGPVGAVSHLRDVADRLESELIAQAQES